MSDAPPVDIAPMLIGGDMYVDLRTWTEVESYYRGKYDGHIISALIRLLDSSEWVLDIGANIGFYSVPLSLHLQKSEGAGKVVAFEPHPGNFSRLQLNLKENDLLGVCDCYQIALSDEEKTVDLVMREDFERGSSTGNASLASVRSMDKGFKKTEVKSVKLDQVVDQILPSGAKIGFLKIDIEGHEDRFLDGAKHAIREHKPGMLLEVNRRYYTERGLDPTEAIESRLPSFYRFFLLRQGNLVEQKTLEEFPDMSNAFLLPDDKV